MSVWRGPLTDAPELVGCGYVLTMYLFLQDSHDVNGDEYDDELEEFKKYVLQCVHFIAMTAAQNPPFISFF